MSFSEQSAPSKTVRAIVHGRVQGVFFRDSCQQRADELGVTGWVRNRPDGAVEAVFSGKSADVDAMLSWARSGPRRADVTGVDVEEASAPNGRGFEVC